MRVVLIPVPIMDYRDDVLTPIAQDETKNCPPYGVYLLVNVLRAAGHEVTLIDLIAEGTNRVDHHRSALLEADLVGIGATSMSWPTAVDVIKQMRRMRADIRVVVGGIHPSLFDTYLLSRHAIDFVVRGEGELALPALCAALESGDSLAFVPNLSWRSADGRIVRNDAGPKIHASRLTDFPLPAYDLLPKGIYKGLAIESSRGCAFDCSFCSTSYRKSYRGMNPEGFVDRLQQLVPHVLDTTYRCVNIIDDEFSMNPKRAMAIIRELRRRRIKLGLVYDSRANDLLFPGYVDEIAEYTHQFLIGAECGYDEGLEKIGKGTTCAKLEAAAAMLQKHGIAERADFSFIMGLPWEGVAEIRATIAFAMRLYSEYGVRILLQWYCQIPGSRLWEDARQKHRVTEAMYDDYGFFRNLYLWSTTTDITPAELWGVVETIQKLQWLSSYESPNMKMIEHAVPSVLAAYFPPALLADAHGAGSGLVNLRELSTAKARANVPQRTTYEFTP